MKNSGLVRVVSVAISATIIMNYAGGGIASAATSLFALVAQDPLPPPFSARTTQHWYGESPGRELRTRGGFYTERALDAIEVAAQKWRRTSGG